MVKRRLLTILLAATLVFGDTMGAFAVEINPAESENIISEVIEETEGESPSPSESPSVSSEIDEEVTESESPSPSVTPSESPEVDEEEVESESPSPSETPSESPSASIEVDEEAIESESPSPSVIPSESPSPSAYAGASPSVSPSASPEATPIEEMKLESEDCIEDTYLGNIDIPYEFEHVSSDMSLEEVLPSSYKTSDVIKIPNTRNQGSYGTCWAHATIALCEINAIKNNYETSSVDFSELHLAYFSYYGDLYDPLGGFDGSNGTHDSNNWVRRTNVDNLFDNGGNVDLAINILSSWTGIADESTAPYGSASSVISTGLSNDIARNDAYHIKNGYIVHLNTERDIAKKLIMDYGAVSGAFYALQSGYYVSFEDGTKLYYRDVYNSENNCYYFPHTSNTNHAITIVGWDDNFSADNFARRPEGDGAWLIRNSWNTDNVEDFDGYFWMSYYDKSLRDEACAIEIEEADIYDNNYQYDGSMLTSSHDINYKDYKYANVFETANDNGETITGAAFKTDASNVDYKIEICTGIRDGGDPSTGTIVATQRGTTIYPGYYTVALSEENQVYVGKGDRFAIIVTLTKSDSYPGIEYESSYKAGGYNSTAVAKSGQSYKAPSESNSWSERTSGNYRIKAFTVNKTEQVSPTSIFFDGEIESSGLSLWVGQSELIDVTILPSNASNKKIIWTSSDSSVASVTSAGKITANKKGTAIITATTALGGISKSFTVNVDQSSITGINITSSSSKYYYKSKEYDFSVNPIPSTEVIDKSKIIWSSSDSSIVSIDENGHAICNGVGDARITASYEGISASTAVSVYPNTVSASVSVSDDNVVTLSWKHVEGAEKYSIKDVGTGSIIATITTDGRSEYSYTDTRYKGTTSNKELTYTIYTYEKSYGMGTSFSAKVGPVYTITYHVENGINNPSNPTKFRNGEWISLFSPTPNTGYRFSYWYLNPEYSGSAYSSSIIGGSSNLDLYAKMTPINYYVYYEGNGAAGYMSYSIFSYGSSYNLTKNTFIKSGHEFLGWNTAPDGSGQFFTDEELVSNLATRNGEYIYLYAQWSSESYTLFFDANGGEVSPASKAIEYNKAYGDLPVPTKAGYDFKGWYTSKTGGSKVTSDTVCYLTGNKTIYAQWTPKKYTLTFNGNGGTPSEESREVAYQAAYGTLPTATRPGYELEGWYTAKEGGTKVTSSTTLSTMENKTVYAHWNPANINIIFIAGDGRVSPTYKNVIYNETYGDLPIPTNSGYRFLGWFTLPTGGTEITSTSKVEVTEEQYLYAHYTEAEYTITFDANGGSVTPANKTVTYKGTYGTLPVPTKEGYDFVGWYTAKTGGTEVTAETVLSTAGNQTVYAHWTAIKYILTFDGNGGTPSEESREVAYQAAYGTLPTATRPGYELGGWYTAKEGGTKVSASTILSTVGNKTVYAHWTPVSVTIRFNAGDGNVSPTSKSVKYSETYGDLPTPTYTGYRFLGWFTLPTGGTEITPTSKVEVTGVQTLYAHYTEVEYTVTFNANGGSVTPANKTVTYKGTYGTLPVPTKEGYDFDGWYTAKTGGTEITAETVLSTTGNKTVYAHWTPAKYILTFDGNGGTPSEESREVAYQAAYGTLPTATRPGYELEGWYTAKEGGTKVSASTILSIVGNKTVYAHWTEADVHIGFNANGGTVKLISKDVKFNGEYGELPTPSRAGYDFVGWFTLAEGGSEITAKSKVTVTEPQTLYAHWTEASLTVNFDANGGNASQNSKAVKYNSTYGTLPTATKEGYDFAGWFTSLDDGEEVTATSIMNSTNGIILFAHWTGKKYTVTFDADGGSVDKSEKSVTFGEAYGILPSATKKGYELDGWYTAKNVGNQVNETTIVNIASNHTLYAHWSAAEYILRYDARGGSVSPTEKKVKYNEKVGDLDTPTKAGCTFDYWYILDENNQEIIITKDTTVDFTENKILYARWKGATIRVQFEDHGRTVTPKTKDVIFGETYGDLPIPSANPGYEFLGWCLNNQSSQKEIPEGQQITKDTEVTNANYHTLFAWWKDADITITLDANGGTVTPATVDVTYHDVFKNLPTPSYPGYDFLGWFTAAEGGTEVNEYYSLNNPSMTIIYAHWKGKDIFVNLDSTGGICDPSRLLIPYKSAYGELPVPTKAGANFLGWFTEKTGGTKVTSTTILDTPDTVTIYAHWENKYTVATPKTNPVGGNNKETAIEIKAGSRITITSETNGSAVYYVINNPSATKADILEGNTYTDAIIALKENANAEGYISISAVAIKEGNNDSSIATVWYKLKDESADFGDVSNEIKEANEWTDASDIPDGFWIYGIPTDAESPLYTGKAITLSDLKIFHNKSLLKEGTDYALKYTNNIKAGEAKITITGKGNYSGTLTETFRIKPLSLGTEADGVITNDANISIPDISLLATGRAQKGTTTVSYKVNSAYVTLKKGTDFDYVYDPLENYADAKDYTVKIIGKGNYAGTACFKESILEKTTSKVLISKTTVEKIPSQPLTGSAVEPRSAIRLKYRASAKEEWKYLEEGEDKDYVVSFTNNINAGTATAIIEGRGNYSGVRYVTFTIAGTPITKATVEGLPKSKEYTGTALELTDPYRLYIKATKTTSEIPLTKDVDYKVSYLKNVAKGTATVTFTGINGYTGTLKKTFAITAHTLTDADLTAKETSVTYTKGGAVPDVTLTYNGYTLVKGTDYTITCANNKAVTTAATTKKPVATITGKGNFAGKLTFEYEITGSNLDNVEMTAADVVYTGRAAGAFKTTVKLVDKDGKVLVAGTDYDRTITYTYEKETEVKIKSGKTEASIIRNPGDSVDKNDILQVGTEIRVTVTGKNWYYTEEAGVAKTKSVIIRVVKADISRSVVKVKYLTYFTGKDIEPGKEILEIKIGGKPIEDTDYEITGYSMNYNKGTGHIYIKGIGNYGGIKTINFIIKPKTLIK